MPRGGKRGKAYRTAGLAASPGRSSGGEHSQSDSHGTVPQDINPKLAGSSEGTAPTKGTNKPAANIEFEDQRTSVFVRDIAGEFLFQPLNMSALATVYKIKRRILRRVSVPEDCYISLLSDDRELDDDDTLINVHPCIEEPLTLTMVVAKMKQLVEMPFADKNRDPLWGAVIMKNINGELFLGKIIDIEARQDTQESIYLVRWDDWDLDYLTRKQIEKCNVAVPPRRGN